MSMEWLGGYYWEQLSNQMDIAEMQNALGEAQLEAQQEMHEASLENAMEIAQGGWEVQREGIAAQLKMGMAQLGFQKERMKKLEIPDLESQIRMREHQMMMAEKIFTLNKAELGLQVLQFEAQLGGPNNWVQAVNFARGVNEGGYAKFVDNLLRQREGAAFGAPVDKAPDRQTIRSLARNLEDGGRVQDSRTYKKIEDILLQGGHRRAPGTVEDLSDVELAMMSSVARDMGLGNEGMMRWLQDYQNSRVGTENIAVA